VAWLGPDRRVLRETQSYAEAFEQLGDAAAIDESLLIITEAIARNPEVYKVVSPYKQIRTAKTDPMLTARGVAAGLIVWFRIVDANTVDLLYIEPYQPETDV
jgi:hypothetical protein